MKSQTIFSTLNVELYIDGGMILGRHEISELLRSKCGDGESIIELYKSSYGTLFALYRERCLVGVFNAIDERIVFTPEIEMIDDLRWIFDSVAEYILSSVQIGEQFRDEWAWFLGQIQPVGEWRERQ